MKLVGVMSTAVLSLTLGATALAFAQEQHDQKEEEKAKPAQQEEKKTPPHKPSKAEKKAAQQQKANPGRQEKTAQENKDAKPQDTKPQDAKPEDTRSAHQQPAQQAQPDERAEGTGGHGGGRIPDDRFRAHFGEEHKFRVSQADYGRDRRFQYGGYTFGFVDAWPTNWLYTEDVFVIEINGVYYLCNASYPGVNIALSIAL